MIFSRFERLMAKRYLRAKRKEGFISVITGFAFTGIALGVATLIIVMSVMNGFREELLSRILGINGHIGIISSVGMPFNNYQQAVKDIAEFDDVKSVIPWWKTSCWFLPEKRLREQWFAVISKA